MTRIGSGFGYHEERPFPKGKLCFSVNGFTLHAARSINTHRREELRDLIEYLSRGPISNERLELTGEGNIRLSLKSGWSDGTTHLQFTPGEFLEKLSALIPPPRTHLVRWGGVFGPNSPYRKEITLKPTIKKGFQFLQSDTEKTPLRSSSWAQLLSKVFKIDVSVCSECGGEMQITSAIRDPDEVRRYLKHVGLECDPPARAPPKMVQGSFEFEQYEEAVTYLDS